MLRRPQNWDAVQAKRFGEFVELPPGGYKCVIVDAKAATSTTKKEMLVVQLEIASGEYAGHFKTLPDNLQFQARLNQLTERVENFKALIEDIESSNPGFIWNWDEESLVGKYCCGVFGREQYESKSDGKPRFSTRLSYITSLGELNAGIEPPKDKLLDIGAPKPKASDSFFTPDYSVDDLPPFMTD